MKLLWLQSGGCGGCTLSWLGYEHGPLFQVLADEGVELVWHPSVSEASVDEALELISHCADGQIDLDVLCIEGSLLRGPQGTGAYHRFGGGDRSMAEWVRQIARRARHVVAVLRQLASIRPTPAACNTMANLTAVCLALTFATCRDCR